MECLEYWSSNAFSRTSECFVIKRGLIVKNNFQQCSCHSLPADFPKVSFIFPSCVSFVILLVIYVVFFLLHFICNAFLVCFGLAITKRTYDCMHCTDIYQNANNNRRTVSICMKLAKFLPCRGWFRNETSRKTSTSTIDTQTTTDNTHVYRTYTHERPVKPKVASHSNDMKKCQQSRCDGISFTRMH